MSPVVLLGRIEASEKLDSKAGGAVAFSQSLGR